MVKNTKGKKTNAKAKKPARKRDENKIVSGLTCDATAKAWERRSNESSQAYEAFLVYLNMADRTKQKATAKIGKSYALIKRWASQHDWDARTQAYDSEMQEGAMEIAQERVAEDVANFYEGMLETAKKLKEKADAAMKIVAVDEMSPKDIVSFYKLSAELVEVANGSNAELEEETTDENDVQIYVPDNGRMIGKTEE